MHCTLDARYRSDTKVHRGQGRFTVSEVEETLKAQPVGCWRAMPALRMISFSHAKTLSYLLWKGQFVHKGLLLHSVFRIAQRSRA
jgi:hypothetical protein